MFPSNTLLSLLALAFAFLVTPALSQGLACPYTGGVNTACLFWFSNVNCTNPSTESSVVVQRNGVCALVPSSFSGVPFSSYKTTCSPTGADGVVEYCSSSDCSIGCISSPFTASQCMANDPVFGSLSLEILCAVPPTSASGASPSASFTFFLAFLAFAAASSSLLLK